MKPNVDDLVASLPDDEREYLLEFTRSSQYVHPFYVRHHVPHMRAKMKGFVSEDHSPVFKIELKLTPVGGRVRRALVQLRRATKALNGAAG